MCIKFIIPFLFFSILSFSQKGITIEPEIKKVNCNGTSKPTSTKLYLHISVDFEYEDYETMVAIEILGDNGKYRNASYEKVSNEGIIKYSCGGLKYGTYTYRFYAYPKTGKYINFRKIPSNKWTYKDIKVSEICK